MEVYRKLSAVTKAKSAVATNRQEMKKHVAHLELLYDASHIIVELKENHVHAFTMENGKPEVFQSSLTDGNRVEVAHSLWDLGS